MRVGELECLHSVGHSAGVHGCDGCCTPIIRNAKAEAWEEGYTAKWHETYFEENPYRQAERLAAFEKATPEDYTQGETE